jgi:TolB-like protein/AraC-like DNA-binding protein
MREDEGRRLSIVYLVAHCGVSERTLHKHFRLFMEVSPLEYWRRHRLAAAREVFLKATSDTSVTEVATRFGFSHFGRFSQQYRRCFDETPSETLQRNRIAQGKRTAPAGGDGANASGAVGVATRVCRERPSVTVIPFRVPAEWLWFGESLAEGIGAALCRMHSLSVAVSRPRASIPAPGTRRLAREFGTRYLMSGSVTQSGGRMRLIVRLVDAATGFHVWGDTYDGSDGRSIRIARPRNGRNSTNHRSFNSRRRDRIRTAYTTERSQRLRPDDASLPVRIRFISPSRPSSARSSSIRTMHLPPR